jgi:hypothetical protein
VIDGEILPFNAGFSDLLLVRRMRAAVVLLAFVYATSASAEPRVIGRISQDDVRGITAAIRAVAPDRIVWIRATPSVDRVGVQTESSPDAGCHYLVERSGGAWHVGAKSCWTHTQPWPDDASKKWPRVARPSELSESDFTEIKRVVAKQTHDDIRSIKVISRSALSVQVHTASPHVVTEGDFTLQKVGAHWQITKKDEWIH